ADHLGHPADGARRRHRPDLVRHLPRAGGRDEPDHAAGRLQPVRHPVDNGTQHLRDRLLRVAVLPASGIGDRNPDRFPGDRAVAARNDDEQLTGTVGPVVSSAHLANSSLPALSEIEFALTMSNNAFQRWMVRCMAAAGGPAMSPLEVLIVHLVNHRERPKTLADICLVLNIEDTHLASYAIK